MDWNQPIVYQIASLAAVVAVVLIVTRLVGRGVDKVIEDNSSLYRLKKTIGAMGYVAVGIAAIVIFGKNVSGLGLSLGVAGAGIAFALQEVITSIAGWIAILTSGFFRPGDRVMVGGISGDVIDIGVLRTTIMETGGWVKGDLYNGRIVRVANSLVFNAPIYNYSADFPFLWDEIIIPIRHGCDHHLARKMLEEVCSEVLTAISEDVRARWEHLRQSYRLEDANLEPMVTLVANDNWMEFTVRYVVDYKVRRTTKDRLFQAILDKIAALDGALIIASATLEVVSPPASK